MTEIRGDINALLAKVVLTRFWEKVEFEGPIPEHAPELGPCWQWTAALDHYGYDVLNVNGNARKVHQIGFLLEHGSLPPKCVPDHLCRNPRCVRGTHMEAVTRADNMRRGLRVALKTHCVNGHPWVAENIGHQPNQRCTDGWGRYCLICRRERRKRRDAVRPDRVAIA